MGFSHVERTYTHKNTEIGDKGRRSAQRYVPHLSDDMLGIPLHCNTCPRNQGTDHLSLSLSLSLSLVLSQSISLSCVESEVMTRTVFVLIVSGLSASDVPRAT